jgi:hypothetical protein
MPKTYEISDSVFNTRKKDLLIRIDYLRGLVDKFNPENKNHKTISDLDYLLDSLDDVIKDMKERTGLTDAIMSSADRKFKFKDGSVIKASCAKEAKRKHHIITKGK